MMTRDDGARIPVGVVPAGTGVYCSPCPYPEHVRVSQSVGQSVGDQADDELRAGNFATVPKDFSHTLQACSTVDQK